MTRWLFSTQATCTLALAASEANDACAAVASPRAYHVRAT